MCFPKSGSREEFIKNTVIDRGYDSSTDYGDDRNRYHLIETQRDANSLFKTQFTICSQTMGETIRYAGTSTVARDIDYITTLLDGEDALMYVFTYDMRGIWLMDVCGDACYAAISTACHTGR